MTTKKVTLYMENMYQGNRINYVKLDLRWNRLRSSIDDEKYRDKI